ncbi:MAG: TonB-dependent receptor plug domain-containing protein, partial [Gemmatimonadetes bacterium]|nr:TonB-dependent receptor plug domain-containing protein [Gemmatimonadota bacterium]
MLRRAIAYLTACLATGLMPVAKAQVPESTSVVLTPISIIGSLSQPGSDMIPYSSTVRDRTSLDRTGRPNRVLSDVLGGVVGVQVQDRFNYALGDRLSIRGFGARAQFGVRGVKVYVDGIPATLPDGQTTLDHVEPGLVTRIEVIRGAVSSFYGNAGGGVIHLGTQLGGGVVGVGHSLRSTLGSNGLRRVQTEL